MRILTDGITMKEACHQQKKKVLSSIVDESAVVLLGQDTARVLWFNGVFVVSMKEAQNLARS